jgi:hypothetical protein
MKTSSEIVLLLLLSSNFLFLVPETKNQGWGKIRPIQIRIRIREYSANSNFASECTIRRIRIRSNRIRIESNPSGQIRRIFVKNSNSFVLPLV